MASQSIERDSLSNLTDLEGPASAFTAEGVDVLASDCTAIVRAIAVFCFLRSRPESSSEGLGRFGGIFAACLRARASR